MTCPFCGACESCVVRSEGRITTDRVRRRRECAECGRRFPTGEQVDYVLLRGELEASGELAQLGDRVPASLASWDDVDGALHTVWGQAKDGLYDKAAWKALQRAIDDRKR
jgi:hypothetical protein